MPEPTGDTRLDALAALLDAVDADTLVALDHLLTTLARVARPFEPVLRAGRFEVVDSDGRVRAVLGDLSTPAGPYRPGLALRSRDGEPTVLLHLTPEGAALDFAFQGDIGLVLGVDDRVADAAIDPGPYLSLIGRDGAVALGWRVADDGPIRIPRRRRRRGARLLTTAHPGQSDRPLV